MEIGKYVEATTRNPFLKSKDVSSKGTKFKITDVQTAPKTMKFSDLVATLQNGKKVFTWGLAFANFTTSELCGRLGTNTDKWIGKTITLIKVPGKKKGQFYINLAQ